MINILALATLPIPLTVLLVAGGLTSCGKEPAPIEPDIVQPEYQGAWRFAATAIGDDTPVAIECTAINGVNSRATTINVTKTGYAQLTVYYVSSTECTGEHRIEIPREYKLVEVEKSESEQVLSVATHTFTVNVYSDRAALFLNTERACGHEDWQEATYEVEHDNLRDCELVDGVSNAGTLLFPIPSEEELASTRVRLSSQGEGIQMEAGDFSDGNVVYDERRYFAK